MVKTARGPRVHVNLRFLSDSHFCQKKTSENVNCTFFHCPCFLCEAAFAALDLRRFCAPKKVSLNHPFIFSFRPQDGAFDGTSQSLLKAQRTLTAANN